MPRIAGVSTPKYRKHRPTGQAVVSIAGKVYYLGPHGTKASRIEYDRLLGEWLASGRQMAVDATSDLTITEVLAHYCAATIEQVQQRLYIGTIYHTVAVDVTND
jgi:hypothetical protein